MSLAGKLEVTGRKKITVFCCAVAATVVALALLPEDAWTLNSSNRRPPLSSIPMPDAALLTICWLGGWFVALFATEESDYRLVGAVGIAVSIILGALMFAPLV